MVVNINAFRDFHSRSLPDIMCKTYMFTNLIVHFLPTFTNSINAKSISHLEGEGAGLLFRPSPVDMQEFCLKIGFSSGSQQRRHQQSLDCNNDGARLAAAPWFRAVSLNKWGKCILRTVLHLRCQHVWLNLWFRLKSGTNPHPISLVGYGKTFRCLQPFANTHSKRLGKGN